MNRRRQPVATQPQLKTQAAWRRKGGQNDRMREQGDVCVLVLNCAACFEGKWERQRETDRHRQRDRTQTQIFDFTRTLVSVKNLSMYQSLLSYCIRTSMWTQCVHSARCTYVYITQLHMNEHTTSRQGSRTSNKFLWLVLEKKPEAINAYPIRVREQSNAEKVQTKARHSLILGFLAGGIEECVVVVGASSHKDDVGAESRATSILQPLSHFFYFNSCNSTWCSY